MQTLLMRVWDGYIGANHWTVDYYYWDRQLITGERGKGYLARKKIDGYWIYRHATPEEIDEELKAEAW